MRMFSAAASLYIKHGPRRGKAHLVKPLLALAGTDPVRSRYGVWMVPDARDATNRFSLAGVDAYEPVLQALESLKPGMAFIDIGANAGVFSMYAANRVGPDGVVIAFEPSLKIFAKLIANAVLNRLTNFYPFRVALGPETAIARFAEAGDAHSGIGHLSDQGTMQVLQASYADLAPMIEAIVGDREAIIKIDVEGAEVLVMRSIAALLARPQVRRVVAEISQSQLARFGAAADQIYEEMALAGLAPAAGTERTAHYDEVFSRT